MVYALADGPLAAALIAWQSAWVFGSTEHSIRHDHTFSYLRYLPDSFSTPEPCPLCSEDAFLITPPCVAACSYIFCLAWRSLRTGMRQCQRWWGTRGGGCLGELGRQT